MNLQHTKPTPEKVEDEFNFEPEISSEDWELPAGFKKDGSAYATLLEVVDPNVHTATLSLGTDEPMAVTEPSLSEPSDEQIKDLIVARIDQQLNYNMFVVGEGEIDRQRAIGEIYNNTELGHYLLDFEKEHLENLVKAAQDIYASDQSL